MINVKITTIYGLTFSTHNCFPFFLIGCGTSNIPKNDYKKELGSEMIPVLLFIILCKPTSKLKKWCSSGVVTIFSSFSVMIFQPFEAQSHVINNKVYICKYAISDNFFKSKSRETE